MKYLGEVIEAIKESGFDVNECVYQKGVLTLSAQKQEIEPRFLTEETIFQHPEKEESQQIPDYYRTYPVNLLESFKASNSTQCFEILYELCRIMNFDRLRVGDYVPLILDIPMSEHKGVEYPAVKGEYHAVIADILDYHIVFNIKEPVFYGKINKDNTNEGGFKESALGEYLNTAFLKSIGGLADFFIKNKDGQKITLPTFHEVFGGNSQDMNMNFYKKIRQSDYFKKRINRIKTNVDDDLIWWWLSTPDAANSTNFAVVYSGGGATGGNASNGTGGVSPTFCIA
ncbi:hypothetical protein AGMMS50268_38220 [Spirochaetia bacterium]|nr:hypothetical protein AGMMS50268_38220 [Spirochaetia bacterium]